MKMNEASHIVSELQRKLADLDQKVWIYRREMASEFEKYTDHLVQNVPSEVSETVIQTMNESMKNYPSLYPHNGPVLYSYSPRKSNNHWEAASTSNSVTRSTINSGKEVDPLRPSEHEVEFQGLFTPSYLPLLDCSSRERRSVPPRQPRIQYADKGSGDASDFMQVDASTEVSGSLTPPPEPNVTTSKRILTEIASQSPHESDSGVSRRSALRSSSISPKAGSHNPRRVRFQVAGKEVLPTTSPLCTTLYLYDDNPPSDYDSDDNTESEMIEELGDSEPELEVPSRISSSQALRLLSRRSLEDDGTIWTTVGSTSDDSLDNDLPQEERQEHLSEETLSLNQITFRRPKSSVNTHLEEDLLYTIPRNKRIKSRPQASTENAMSNPSSAQKSYEHGEDHLEVFNFDELSLHPGRNHKFEQQEDSEDDDEDEYLTIKSSKSKSNIYSSNELKSSALTIPKASTTAPETSSLVSLEGISSKDHPFSMPIVRPEIHARAADLGEIITFVGSMDGRTGLDESSASDFRGCIGSPERAIVEDLKTGRPPKSLSERMLLEDLVEEDWCPNNAKNFNGRDDLKFPSEGYFNWAKRVTK